MRDKNMQGKNECRDSFMENGAGSCPYLSTPDAHIIGAASGPPRTMEELKIWYDGENLPPYETTGFFINADSNTPKSFGIYKDGTRYIVYRNKADGKRAVRYSGNDEAYAVSELYLRIKEEILSRKNHPERNPVSVRNGTGNTDARNENGSGGKGFKKLLFGIAGAAVIAVIMMYIYSCLYA